MKKETKRPYSFVKHPTKAQIEVVEKWRAMVLNIPNKSPKWYFKLRDKKLKEYNQVTFWLGMKQEYKCEEKIIETVGNYKK